jgi:3D-(3,5/4)-trihydroxycyclohexane-1,2-dione acylhydrolase (decyclizing)
MPEREVVVLLGDGSWMMLHSELASAVMLGLKLIVVLLDNGGFGCIDRLQRATGGASFNNLLATARQTSPPMLDFAAQAVGLGAVAMAVSGIAELETALATALATPRSSVIVLRTDPAASTAAGGHWWEVAIPAVSTRAEVAAARAAYEARLAARRG